MARSSFNFGWTFQPKTSIFAQLGRPTAAPAKVDLPHDALFGAVRAAENAGKNAYFPRAAAFEYTKSFDVPEDYRNKRVALEFEGAYRDAMVYVNGDFAGQRPYGYSTFIIELDDFLKYGAVNTIRVDVRAHDDSRWYTGCGITRDVVLIVTEKMHLAANGVRITTPDIDAERAVVELRISATNREFGATTVTIETEIFDQQGALVGKLSSPMTLRSGSTEIARQRLYVGAPNLWSPEAPRLYSAVVTVLRDEKTLDRYQSAFGIRSLQLDPIHGLRINGQAVKLRGACIHHDNGLLGAAAIGRAEERRIELLKAAGFNAVRSAHNPISQRMLDACDRLGMLVMDEAFDIWTEAKSSFDYSLHFPEWWERDLEAMVLKDINHPSVIMYSIGNEILETGSPLGAGWGRRLAEKIRALDPTRFVTNGINGFVSTIHDVIGMMRERGGGGTQGVNDMMGGFGPIMNRISASQLVTDRTAEAFSVLDVAGINYGDGRYELDRELFPERIIVGTETFPGHIVELWPLVMNNSHVIGDFTWAGWDYLGEVGIGRTRYADEPPEFEAPYPWLTAWTGDLDMTGQRRTISHFREIVFGLRKEPFIAVSRPRFYGRPAVTGGWAWTDSLNSWSWSADAGAPIVVEVYSPADEVELQVNGVMIGREPAGRAAGYRARFDTTYQPGSIVAIAYCDGVEDARSSLVTAGSDIRLVATADRAHLSYNESDLSFVTIELQDEHGVVVTDSDISVSVTVSGAGALAALGTGRPYSLQTEADGGCLTFNGCCLAIVRPNGLGPIAIEISAEGLGKVLLQLHVDEASHIHR
jgi:beta-galactosidase